MGISSSWGDSLDIIALHPVKILWGVRPVGLSAPWENYIDIIAL